MTDHTNTHLPIISLGTRVEPYGVVESIHSRAGYRSYFMVDEHGVVTLMPAELMPAPADNGEKE